MPDANGALADVVHGFDSPADYIARGGSTGAICGRYGNRIGYGHFTLPQLKILQEVITLAVFVPFAVLYMDQPVRIDYLWAALCMLGAVYFIFRS